MPQLHLLHRGCISSVYCTGDADDGHKVIKAYHKRCDLQPRHWLNISREVAILTTLRDLGVPGVVQLCGTVDDAANMYLAFKPCSGGDLYKRLAHCGLLSEAQLCREVIIPLLKVLASLHELGIIHRDIKPENIFFDADGGLRLGDFGLAIRTPDRATSRVGTLDYMAPEVLAQPSPDFVALHQINPRQLPCYDTKVDIWALGVLVYESLMGMTPFAHPDPETASLQAQFRRPAPLRPGVSTACADFVARVLTKQVALRPTALQLLGHPWVQGHMAPPEAAEHCAAAQQWLGGGSTSAASMAASIERVTSCPAAATPEATPNPTQLGVPAAEPLTGGGPSSCTVDSNCFINMSHFLHQTLKQAEVPQLPLRQGQRQRAWERLMQQHRQQLSRQGTSQNGGAAADGPAGVGTLQTCAGVASIQRSTSACLDRELAGVGVDTAAAATAGADAPGAKHSAACYIPASGQRLSSAVASVAASSVPTGSIMGGSLPVSPAPDSKSRPSYWLSPQQPAAKQYKAPHNRHHSGQQHPAILAGLPAYAGVRQPVQRPAVLMPGAAAAPAQVVDSTAVAGMQCGYSNGLTVQYHMLGSPLAQQGDARLALLAAMPFSPARGTPPAGSRVASCFQLTSPCRAMPAAAAPAAAEPGRRQNEHAVWATRGLARHGSTGLLQLQLQQQTSSCRPSSAYSNPQPAAAAAAAVPKVQRELLQGQQPGDSGFLSQLQQSASGDSAGSHASGSRPSSRASSSLGSRSCSPDLPCSPNELLLDSSSEYCAGSGVTFLAAEDCGSICSSTAPCWDDVDNRTTAGDQAGLDIVKAAGAAKHAAAAAAGGAEDDDEQDLHSALDLSRAGMARASTAAAAAAAAVGVPVCAVLAAVATSAGAPAVGASSGAGLAVNSKTRARSLWKKVCQVMAKPQPLAA